VSDGAIRVALTFDAEHPDRPRCPPDAPDRILDALAASRARATFFVQGRWAESYPERAKRIAADGHLVGNHSHYHARMTLLHDAGVVADVEESADHIVEATGVDPRPWFRTPFGDGHDDARILSALEGLGYRNVYYHVVLYDWEPDRPAEDIVEHAVQGAVEHGDGAVVLLHVWPGPTADAVPAILDRLNAHGSRFVGVDELEALP
jgi:peptidoglycan-N-acetylglucosamine deacetylase